MAEQLRGGSFLTEEVKPSQIFAPEDFTEEHRMIAKTVDDFIAGEVEPVKEEIEKKDKEVLLKVMRAAGELGLLGADIPEEHDGMALDKISSGIIAEGATRGGGSFAVTFGAHTGIGALPIVLYGTKDQRERYLPSLASGEKIAAYCLTEPTAGSDALAIQTKATLTEDGSAYLLNGTKQFITNAAIADVFIIYAKVDGEKFTAFIVDGNAEGFSIGPEEEKLGLKGSSTNSVILEDARVPKENVLGEMGRGHLIAFNILNIGRYKLAAGCIGAGKAALEESVHYAIEREQFKRPIAEFGMIKEKLAMMNTLIYITESMLYRTIGLIQEGMADIDLGEEGAGTKTSEAIKEYAIECSINKIFGSEMLDKVVDEGVQIFGGYGYTEEYPLERMYRDSRINRIFEGTNEVNRLIIPATVIRKAMKGQLNIMEEAMALQKSIIGLRMPDYRKEPLGAQKALLEAAKKILLMVSGTAAQQYGEALREEEELVGFIADMAILLFAMESGYLRALKEIEKGSEAVIKRAMVEAYFHEAFYQLEYLAKTALAAMSEGDILRTQLAVLKKLTVYTPINVVKIRRSIADEVIQAKGYSC